MKVLITILLLSSTARAVVERRPCVQSLYDSIYSRLVAERFKFNLEKLDIVNRDGIEIVTNKNGIDPELFDIFRRLCRGQKSMYEREDKYENY